MSVTVAGVYGDLGAQLDRRGEIRTALQASGGVPPAAVAALVPRIGDDVAKQLDIEIGDLVLEAWSTHHELRDAIQHTRDNPGQLEEVRLTQHEIAWTHQPAIEVYLNNQHITTLTFDVTVVLGLLGIVAVLRSGSIEQLRWGDVTVRAALSLAGQDLVERQVSYPIGIVVEVPRGDPSPETAPPSWRTFLDWIKRRRRVALVIGSVLLATVIAWRAEAVPSRQEGVAAQVRPNQSWNVRAMPFGNSQIVGVVHGGDRCGSIAFTPAGTGSPPPIPVHTSTQRGFTPNRHRRVAEVRPDTSTPEYESESIRGSTQLFRRANADPAEALDLLTRATARFSNLSVESYWSLWLIAPNSEHSLRKVGRRKLKGVCPMRLDHTPRHDHFSAVVTPIVAMDRSPRICRATSGRRDGRPTKVEVGAFLPRATGRRSRLPARTPAVCCARNTRAQSQMLIKVGTCWTRSCVQARFRQQGHAGAALVRSVCVQSCWSHNHLRCWSA